MPSGTGHVVQYNAAYADGDAGAVMLPKNWKSGGTTRGVIYCHGHGQTGVTPFDGHNYPGQHALIRAVAEIGYPVLSLDLGAAGGGATWGYTPVSARLTSALGYLNSSYGVKNDKVGLMGTSMGGLSSLVWAAANLASVACLVGVGPVNDINDMVANNRGGFAPEINSVYTRTDPATVTSGSPTVTDATITASDAGRTVTGTGVPASATVGNVVAGTSFEIMVGGVATNATAAGTSVTISGYTNTAFGSAYNPTVMAGSGAYGSLPMQLYYGSTDTTVVPATVTTFQGLVGASCAATSLSGGHAESTWQEVPPDTVAAFFAAHL